MSWKPVCGLDACRPGNCAGRGQVPLSLAEAGKAGRNLGLRDALLVSANSWVLVAACCELPAADPRRAVGHRLVDGWPVAAIWLTPAEQEARAAELLDTAAAIVAEVGVI